MCLFFVSRREVNLQYADVLAMNIAKSKSTLVSIYPVSFFFVHCVYEGYDVCENILKYRCKYNRIKYKINKEN